jgi:hypothetical protein|nr:DUF3563 domain-containing protein [Neorhizobium tomejilense]
MRSVIRNIKTFLNTDHIKLAEDTYLNGSLDRFDLEHRQRQIDNGMFRRPTTRGYGLN